ncbi:hypothetical protein EGM85_11950, partial [Macrococcus caseolyticus]
PLRLEIKRVAQGDRTHDNRLRKTSATVPDALQNQIFQYIATIGVGSPPQTCEAAIDTGSSESMGFFNRFRAAKQLRYLCIIHLPATEP